MTDIYLNSITKIGQINISKSLKTSSRVMLLGSCFSTNLHKYLKSIYINSQEGPFGNIYNPISISSSINRLIDNTEIKEEELLETDGLYQHFDFYSKLGRKNKHDFIEGINLSLNSSHKHLQESDILVITLGTAYVYEKDGIVVNNCHKLPGKEFTRRILKVEEIVDNLGGAIERLKRKNSKIKIILTLSPVRHLRDSFTENSLSKAILRLSIEELKNSLKLDYFPSYEIVLDELRDYRWYKDDLTHPSQTAIDYIMGLFINSAGDNRIINYIRDIDKVNRMINHIIVNPESQSAAKFIKSRESKIREIKKLYPEIEGLKRLI